ncbi:MAG: Isoquinoline 1-oxidoreductase subunit [Phenylobacterium sp.]|uniref:Isoquinoline 1-oxidoreductase subunit n=1 Tax=Phenylobacterium sp. TaxID=1871053 RepID=UPI001B7B379A|nr:Isoquinoline 1-oxidoreductase subunit [Phenylobacterium sp.]MBP7648857.1 Isoquinoline 1-oxidoreductase subunit [Phenylobacterium sp.]MBP7815409.1 Isoquinoline 1-oxidoreductase subunit [Phenylobacterium sp.]MBP9231465.1 Isoquinoline 1-oxidoreductase subunit [Phenylobacterium sp.]MBP9754884.1 Isoquinoline 1-oxidoreductase subunit [Phenylobacterium sp.]
MRHARALLLSLGAAGLVAAATLTAQAQTAPSQAAASVLAEMEERTSLKPATAFNTITDKNARSVALFQEAGKVITHPRCANCHPVDRPTQGDDRRPHMPVVARGGDGHGEGLQCASCHTAKNVWVGGTYIVTIPGNPKWALAPASMAWQGKSLGEICAQIKDPARNGGKTLAQIQEHMAVDELVAWGWNPGLGRAAAPGTQAQLGELIQAWIDTGASCPAPGGAKVPSHDLKIEAGALKPKI